METVCFLNDVRAEFPYVIHANIDFFIGCRQNSELIPKFHVALRFCRPVLPTSNFRHDAAFRMKKRNKNLAKIFNNYSVVHNQSINFPLPHLLTFHCSRLRLAFLYLKDERALLANHQSNQCSVLHVVYIVPVTAFPSPSASPALPHLFSSFFLFLFLLLIINFIITT